MAEFPELGEHCQVDWCKQLDFLPFICSGCSAVLCLEHRSKSSHNCPSVCNEGESSEIAINSKTKETNYRCFIEDCDNTELVPVICEHCQQNFCLRHRHQQNHQCCALPECEIRVSPEQRIQQITGKELSREKKGRGGVRSESRAAKVALMKLKMHAVGDKSIPQEERIYFNVVLPIEEKKKQTPMFFSKCWTVGKIIDKTAATKNLKNSNNTASAEKLRLFASQTGKVVRLEDTLEDLLVHSDDVVLFSGTTVILEYVHDDCVQLNDLARYLT